MIALSRRRRRPPDRPGKLSDTGPSPPAWTDGQVAGPCLGAPRSLSLHALRILLVVVLFALLPTAAHAAEVPPGFTDERVMQVPQPTALAFTPDGGMLVATQPGRLVLRARDGRTTDALNLAGRVCTNSERGLLGVAVDPAFSSNRFIYTYYTFDKFGGCARSTTNVPVNRVARFVLGTDGIARGETILIDNIPSVEGFHNAGDLAFGKDGYLYVSVGDLGCNYADPTRCGGSNNAARDLALLAGKILRVDRNGAAPEANGGGVACATSARAPAGQRCREVFAYGLRNPFRFAFDPNAATTRFFINDVGLNVWEEINEGAVGADYGWNQREGACPRGATTGCGPAPAGMTNPLYAYDHSGGCRSITGGAFVPNGAWGPAYDGNYLYSDYACGRIFRLQRSGTGWAPTSLATGLGSSSAVHLAFGPGPVGPALHYTSYAGGGEVRRLYTAGPGGNGAPTARLSASPIGGTLPLTVRFDASGSSDPEGRALTYLWNFGDGTTAETSGPRTSHIYRREGNFVATLSVRDDRGAVSAAERITIFAGNALPRVTLRSDTGDAYEFGERVRLTASARDPEDGAIPGSRLSWTVVIEHDKHTHPFLGPVSGGSISFRAPAPEDASALDNTNLRVSVSATDRRGLTATKVMRLQPVRRLAALRARLRPTAIRAAGLPQRVRGKRRARGGELSLRLSGAAKLTLARERRAAGRVAGRRCRAITKGNRNGRRCLRWARIPGSHTVSLPRGRSRVSFAGRLRAEEKVARGRYRLVLRARDGYGRRSPVARIAYRVR